MASRKNNLLCNPIPPLPFRKNKQKIYCFKIIESAKTWQFQDFPSPFFVDAINVNLQFPQENRETFHQLIAITSTTY